MSHLPKGPWASPMLNHQLIRVSGPDAAKFLQGQLTCDVRELQDGKVTLGAHCNPKGRMISSFHLVGFTEDHFYLRVRANLADAAFTALKKYIVFSKAELALLDWRGAAFSIETAKTLIGDATPKQGCAHHNGKTMWFQQGGVCEFWGERSEFDTVWTKVDTAKTPCSPAFLEQALIEQGVAEVDSETTSQFLPQNYNLDILGGVNFKKGCYTGQEIIARLHYKGQTKKRLYRARLEPAVALQNGQDLSNAENKPMATVIGHNSHPDFTDCLIVAANETTTDNIQLNLGSESISLAWSQLPYAIPKGDEQA